MRTEYYLCHVLGVKPESRVKFVHSRGISLPPHNPGGLLLSVLRR